MGNGSHIFIATIGKASIAMWLIAAPFALTRYARAQSNPAPKYENGFTLYGGYRFGGSVTDTANDTAIDLVMARVSPSRVTSAWIPTAR